MPTVQVIVFPDDFKTTSFLIFIEASISCSQQLKEVEIAPGLGCDNYGSIAGAQ